jgi:outer membrane protein OmpA-like peptidoglycan-associated protein/opacity protein-like surface antigen
MKPSSRSTLLAGAAAVALSVAAAPLAQAQSNFDGPYVGLGAGYHHFDTGGQTDQFKEFPSGFVGTPIDGPSQSANGVFGDVFAGYGLTLGGPFYVGLEVDGSYSGANKSFTFNNPISGPEGRAKISARWGAGVGVRLGYVITPDLLGYIRGGGGWQEFKGTWTTLGPPGFFTQPNASSSRFAEGVRAGGGFDLSLASWTGQPLFARVEYDHTWYGDTQFGGAGPLGGNTVIHFHPHDDRALLAVAWRFAPPPPPPPQPVAAAPPPPPAPPPPAPPKQFVVYFNFDKSDLTPEGAKVVQDAADAYKQTGSARIAVTGYTDLSGTQRYNLGLSKRRADTVRGALVRDGVPDGVIAEAWRGKENPAVPTPDGVREPRNRRVEIVE